MLSANPGETLSALLQEYGTRIGKKPVYDLSKTEGQAHQPNFTFRVTVGDTSCTGEEGLGSLAGVCIHRARGLISWNHLTVLSCKAREGWRDFRGKATVWIEQGCEKVDRT